MRIADKPHTEFTLLVAGCRGGACTLPEEICFRAYSDARTGKTSFLRLLLDTSSISSTATKEQLANVAKFVQGCNGHTSYIRPTSIDINVDIEGNGKPQSIGLNLVDTPSLDFRDEKSVEWSLSEILRNVEGRFAESVETVSYATVRRQLPAQLISQDWSAQKTDRYVHLCVLMLVSSGQYMNLVTQMHLFP